MSQIASLHRSLPRTILAALACLAPGCVLGSAPVGELAETGTTTGVGSSSTSPSTTNDPSNTGATTSESGESSTSDDMGTTTGIGESSTGPITGCDPELPPVTDDECSVFAQDCPPCYRCTWDKDGNGTADNGVPPVCALVPDDGGAPGDACAIDLATGNDDCATGSFCYPPDTFGFPSRCVAFCAGYDDYACAVPDTVCLGSASQGTFGCFPACDPLLAECADGGACFASALGFACVPTEPGTVDVLGECQIGFECMPGLDCIGADYLDGACDFAGCCTPRCDTDDAGADAACAAIDPALSCRGGCGIFDHPPGFESIGACLGAFELEPGACPPEGIDPEIPWCSVANEDACGELGSFGGGSLCEDWCHCYSDCEDTSECPVPATGTAVVECRDGGLGEANSCVLPCDDGQICPDGMSCTGGFGFCIWETPNGEC